MLHILFLHILSNIYIEKLVEWMLLAFFLNVICYSDYVSDFFFFYNFCIAERTMAVKLFASLRMLVRYVTVQHLLATKLHFLFCFLVQFSFR